MKAKSVLEEMDALEKTVGFGPWERWNRLRHLIEQACAVEELEAAQPAGEAVCTCETFVPWDEETNPLLCAICGKPRR